jgi:hypothetical protein
MVVKTHRIHEFPSDLTHEYEQMHNLQVGGGFIHSQIVKFLFFIAF